MTKQLTVAAMLACFGLACGMPESTPADELATVEQGLSTFGPWSTPINLGNVLNTRAGEAGVHVTKDGSGLYFIANRVGGKGGDDIFVSLRDTDNDTWGAPVRVPALNSAADDFCPSTSSDGHTLVMASSRPGGCGGIDLYISHRANAKDHQGWSTPVRLSCAINSVSQDSSPSLGNVDDGSGNYQLYFWSNRARGEGGNDLYVATIDADGNLVVAPSGLAELNGTTNEQRPDVRRDGKEFFFESLRPGSQAADLYVATGDGEGTWSEVRRVENVNSVGNERSPSLSWDGQTLYFTSDKAGGFGGNDLYVSTRTKKNGK